MSAGAKHTPGPWHHAGRIGGWDGVTSADGIDICHLEYNEPANATLIAAAPDMLAVLKALEAHCRVETTERGNPAAHAAEGEAIRKRVQDAISKAEAS